MKTLLCAGWKKSSCDDGPGIRSVLFLQGCRMNCPGCQNSCSHNADNGEIMTIKEISDFIITNCRNKKITISGGEPLEQLPSLLPLLENLQSKGFNICLYTGWEYNKVPKSVFPYINYLKCGHFDITKRDSRLMYVGSTNQKMYKIFGDIIEEMNLFRLEECA